jgi:predicted metal-dependent enzyme (double-stranded beta helix superfamily)
MTAELDRFLAEARRARTEDGEAWPQALAAAMRRLFAEAGPAALAGELKARISASEVKGIAVFENTDALTIYAVGSSGGLRNPPHDHATTAVVGLIEGAESYRVFRREGPRAVETGRVTVTAPDVAVMPPELIHAMWCGPGEGGISLHAYGNRHFDVPGRRQWDPETLVEEPFDVARQRAWTAELTRAARARPDRPESIRPG